VFTNPYDREGFADQIKFPLEMGAEEKRRRMMRMREHLREKDISKWASSFVFELTKP